MDDTIHPNATPERTTLKVVSLNLAHGRRDGWHQALLRRPAIEANLDAVAQRLRRESVHVAAVQEADGPSIWSGRFNHVEFLARRAEMPHFARGEHVKAVKLDYGTALISRLPLADVASYRFASTPPTPTKGMTVASVAWPAQSGFRFDVVSVHLDFSRKSVRTDQVRQIIDRLELRDRPRIVLGDFNCTFGGKERTLEILTDELNLRAYHPEEDSPVTLPLRRTRVDWVLVSPEFRFIEHRVLDDVLSDHRAVVAELGVG